MPKYDRILKSPPASSSSSPGKNRKYSTTVLLLSFFFLFFGILLFLGLIDSSTVGGFISVPQVNIGTRGWSEEFPLRCPSPEGTTIADRTYPTTHNYPTRSSNITCPFYFRWIHEDLRHWKVTGITREMVERGRRSAHFRLIVVGGKAYVEKYRQALQTRDVYTLWGILQLLRWYPGRVPDFELLFDCDDRPVVRAKDFRRPNSGPPPLFRYCSDGGNLDIVFPDWSFWGWVETNIRPWKSVRKEIKEGNQRSKWTDRIPYAYWRGNPTVAQTRQDLLKCNVTDKYDWNTRLYTQASWLDWKAESERGYKQSNLQDQCTHKYKIYIEGWAWSVSEKYILACNSMTLYIRSSFHDFYIRGMSPLKHYWPIRDNSKCSSLKHAVDWANNHTEEAEAIGVAGSKFVFDEMKMELVYDYMFHLLSEYAKLLRFKPTVPPGALELTSEAMACHQNGTYREFMIESMVKFPSVFDPCELPPPFDPQELREYWDGNVKGSQKVEAWEDEYWKNQPKPN
ncbi:O-glucosyltransferase rumi homolog [Linum grandiflorum]